LEVEAKVTKIADRLEDRFLHAPYYEELEKKSRSLIKGYLEDNPHRAAMPFEELRSKILKLTDSVTFRRVVTGLEEKGILRRKNSGMSLVGYESELKPRDREVLQEIEQYFRWKGFSSPKEEEIKQIMRLNMKEFKNFMYHLLQRGILVRLSEKVVYHRDAVEKARQVVLQYLAKYPSITVAELRDILQLSRKYATAILEYFDRTGLTKRDKDVHILK